MTPLKGAKVTAPLYVRGSAHASPANPVHRCCGCTCHLLARVWERRRHRPRSCPLFWYAVIRVPPPDRAAAEALSMPLTVAQRTVLVVAEALAVPLEALRRRGVPVNPLDVAAEAA